MDGENHGSTLIQMDDLRRKPTILGNLHFINNSKVDYYLNDGLGFPSSVLMLSSGEKNSHRLDGADKPCK